jgi:hypothetical protein
MPARMPPIGRSRRNRRSHAIGGRCRWRIGTLVLFLLCTARSVLAEPLERAIEATYLPKFAPFVEWPPSSFAAPESPLTICLLANDPLAPLVELAVTGQKDGSRPIVVRRLAPAESAAGCHILYFEPGDAAAAQLAASVQNRPVLTVTSSGQNPASHAMIIFVIDEDRVRFDIDDALAAHTGLDISSNLLALARNVRPAP